MEAPASITCPDCRARWQKYHDEDGRAIIHTPVSYLKIYTGDDLSNPVLARSYHELRSAVLPMEVGSRFVVELVAYMLVVGCGSYTRIATGFEVIEEEGACLGLALAMREAIASD